LSYRGNGEIIILKTTNPLDI